MSPAEPWSNSTSSLQVALATKSLEAVTYKGKRRRRRRRELDCSIGWEHAQTIISAPSCVFCCLVKPCHPSAVSADVGCGRWQGPHHPGKALSGGVNWPEKCSRTSAVAPGYPSCRLTTHHPWQEDVKLCYRNMLFIEETDGFQLAIPCIPSGVGTAHQDLGHLWANLTALFHDHPFSWLFVISFSTKALDLEQVSWVRPEPFKTLSNA